MAKKDEAQKQPEPETPEPSEAEKQFTGIPVATGPGIDERMADLLKDHQAMGARPK